MTAPRGRWRRYFFVGLIVIAPVGVTAWILYWLFRQIDSILGEPLQAALGIRIPGLGLLLLAMFVLLVGWIVHQAVGRRVLHWWNDLLGRFPFAGRLYHAASQIVQTVVGDQQKLFRRAVLVPYPMDGMWAVGFVTSERSPGVEEVVGEPCANVFVPTTPNPTSGFMMVVPLSRLRAVNVSIEDAMKLIISAGAVVPRGSQPAMRRGLDIETLLKETHD